MAELLMLMVGAGVGEAVSKLSDVIIDVITKTSQFKSSLTELQQTVTRIKPIINQMEELNIKLDRPIQETEMFIAQLKDAQDLVRDCLNIKWRFFRKYPHSLKLENLNKSLLRFCHVEVQLLIARCVLDLDLSLRTRESSGSSCGVPLPKGDVIGFEDRIKDLKAMVLNHSEVDDCSVVVVSAAGGYGKTTLVTQLCHDRDIQGKFGENIYFATISETPNIKVVVKNLLQKNQGGQQLDFLWDEDATHQWGRFLGGNTSQVLLVLDDVWDVSFVKKFKFKSPTYTILVTSRSTFKEFNTYELQLLNDQDATKLFWQSAFSSNGSESIDDILRVAVAVVVDELVKHCNNHPLALVVIGGLLKGKEVAIWKRMLKNLSTGARSIFNLHNSIPDCLERSLDMLEEEPAIKQCYLDLGLFPEDQKIAATMLMDMWVHLYNHDEEGLDTINKLTELSSRNLATWLPIRKHFPVKPNYCEEESVVQHDMMRRLAICLSSQEPIKERMRLIINANETNRLLLSQLHQTLEARVLSISTDERFSMAWNDYQVPKVEVFVLNLMSKIYELPPFMQNMERLKVLIITNYGYYFSELCNFPAPQYLSGLTRIRLDHVLISSISTSILDLVNLRKLSLIMCKIGNSFNECTPNKLPCLLEIEIDSCDDLVTFPAMFCNLVGLKKVSITNCLELISLSEGFGNLTNLEVLLLASCSKLMGLPESVIKLHKLRILDINYCLHLDTLPAQIGELGSLRTIHMRGCTGLHDLPSSVKDLCPLEVVCDEEMSLLWSHLTSVKLQVVVEDRMSTLLKIIPGGIEEFHPASEPNREVIDRQFLTRDKTKYLLQRDDAMTRRKDYLHLIWFYTREKKAKAGSIFGFLVDKFSLLNKYIRYSSRDEKYYLTEIQELHEKYYPTEIQELHEKYYPTEIQELLQDIERSLNDAASDILPYLPERLVMENRFGSVEFENLATGSNSLSASFWSDIPEVHASAIASASRRALSCIKDFNFKKVGISGNGAKKVAETLKDTPELRRRFDVVLCVALTNDSIDIKQLMDNIEKEILLWKKISSKTGNKINDPDEFLNCLLFIDYGTNLVDLHEIEFLMSYWYRSVQIVMTSELENVYFQMDLEIRIPDHFLPWVLFSTNVDLATMGKYPRIQQMATLLVEECHDHLFAIILLAKSLRGVVDATAWELALQELKVSQQEPSSSSSEVVGVTSDVMVRIFRFIWSRMKTPSKRCIVQFALQYQPESLFDKSSLIDSWIRDGLVKGEQEGEDVFEDLTRSFLLEPVEKKTIKMRDDIQVTLVAKYGLHLTHDGSESKKMPNVEEWDALEIHLTNNILSELPDTPDCPILMKLFLNSNQDLMDIPITFFHHMPSLQVVNFSSTSIRHLPSSISKLTSLQQLIMRDCHLLMELPPEIGELTNLRIFDSEGTQLISLPEQFGFLTNLECLKFSLYNRADRYKQSKQVIPATALSELKLLKELSICMDSYGEWWEDEAKLIIDNFPQDMHLESLKLYFPTTGLLRAFMEKKDQDGLQVYQNLSNFSLIIGHLQQSLISRLPLDVDNMFVQLPKCLKYTNGDGDTKVIAMAVKHAHALFLDRHSTIQSLSTFGAKELRNLKFCLLAECNKMLEIVDGSYFYEVGDNKGSYVTVLYKLEYLAIHYMKSLSCIWKGPIRGGCLANLKTLVIHVCPELRTILTKGMIDNLTHLEYLMVENCANVNSLLSLGSYHPVYIKVLPKLKNISLLHLPQLDNISCSVRIAPRLESLVIYDCPKLEKLSPMEVCDNIKEIKGEKEWWDALKWCEKDLTSGRLDYLARLFIPLGIDDDIMDGLADDVDFLPHLCGGI